MIKPFKLNEDVSIPQLGFGTYMLKGYDAIRGVETALEAGYRSIDTAAFYENEREIGSVIRSSDVPRSELTVTTKLWNDVNDPAFVRAELEKSLEKLGLDFVDIYLMHWPVSKTFVKTWETLISMTELGLAKAVGVCNFHQHHFKSLKKEGLPMPSMNQFELHPLLIQNELVSYCQQNNIVIESWAPIMQGHMFQSDAVDSLAEKYGKTKIQIVLRWHIERNFVVIPRSRSPEHIQENIDIFDFVLTNDEIETINSLDCGKRYGPDPDTFV